jgi:hypothetical protein
MGTSSVYFSNPMKEDSIRGLLVQGKTESGMRVLDTAGRTLTSRCVK